LSVRDEAQVAWNAETETYQKDSRGCEYLATQRFARTCN